jgi:glycosyltransferase involved in cell wall biosynthesis
MKPPIVSVVIPVLNAGAFIRESILSVLGQSLDDIELIIINDGSTDDTERIVNDTVAEFPKRRITVISRENKGVSRTLNEGLARSRGAYFAYLGADDIWHELKLELQVELLERTGLAAAYSDCWVINENGEITDRYGSQYAYRGGDIYRDIVWARFQPPSPTVLFRRSALESVGGFNEEHIAEDRDVWIRIARRYEIAYINKPLGFYRVHRTNTSANLEHTYEYSMQVLNSTLQDDPSLIRYGHRLRAQLDAFQSGAYYEKLKFQPARRYAVKAILQYPAETRAWRTLIFSLLGKNFVESIRNRRRAKHAKQALQRFNNNKFVDE